MIDEVAIQYCQRLAKRDFKFKTKMFSHKKGRREYLNDVETRDFTTKLNDYFERSIEIPRMKVGDRQTIETLVDEEALLLAEYLRKKEKDWHPRIAYVG